MIVPSPQIQAVGLGRLMLFLGLLGLFPVFTGCRAPAPSTPGYFTLETLDTGGPLMEEQAAYDVRHYTLELTIDPDRKYLVGQATVEVTALSTLTWLVLDLDARYIINQVTQPDPDLTSTNRFLDFQYRGSRLWISLPRNYQPNESVAVTVHYEGYPRAAKKAPWDGGFTWSTTDDGHPWIATTVQGEGADLWWPCKDHPSDKPDSVTLKITVPRPLSVASNGRLIEVLEKDDDSRTYHWHTAMPISNYNIALNIGPYVTLTSDYLSQGGQTMPVTFWALPESREDAQNLLPEILEHLAFYERHLGPYPFRAEKYGVAQTPHLGMEHQSIIAYGNEFKGGPEGYDWLHHHELGHEWWGNLVTADDWRHFWIHEGFCTYMQAIYAEEREGPMAYHHFMYRNRKRIKNEHALVPDSPMGMRDMSDQLGVDVYFKGAWILHTLRYLIGDDAFFACLRQMAYPSPADEQKTDGSACRFVTTDDFVQLVNRVTGQNYDWFFDIYLYQPELPELVATLEDGKLNLEWKTPDNRPFPMPLEIQSGPHRKRYDLPEGRLTLEAAAFPKALLDPHAWILKKARPVEAGSTFIFRPPSR